MASWGASQDDRGFPSAHSKPTTHVTNAVQDLSTSLRRALAATSFDIGRMIKHNGVHSTSYGYGPDESIEPENLRGAYERATWHGQALTMIRNARVSMPETLRTNLMGSVREALAGYVDPASDCVGHALPIAGDRRSASVLLPNGLHVEASVSSVEQFGEALIKDAAILGVDRVTDLIAGWIRGDPMEYRTCRVAALRLAQAMTPIDGIDIVPLPLSSDSLSKRLPSGGHIQAETYLGRSVVQVATTAEPALFRPNVDDINRVVTAALAPRCAGFDTIGLALTLECNADIALSFGWNDYGGVSAIANNGTTWGTPSRSLHSAAGWSISLETGVTTLQPIDGAAAALSNTSIRRLLAALDHTDARTRLAAARWKKSLTPAAITDQWIDLRIALEALLLSDGTNQQLSYTLAARGAWLLGENAADRREAWRILRSAYAAASRLVHGGRPKHNDRTLLVDAQRLCRKAILRVVHEGQVQDWDGLILDAPSD